MTGRVSEQVLTEEGKKIPEPIRVKVLIDTGASACVLKREIPEKLGLEPVGITKINTPSSKDHECYRYFLRMIIHPLSLGDQPLVYEGPVIAAPLDGQEIGGLIGRDVLKSGILIYIGYMNQVTFSLL